jgi:hemerythrin-like domain-containing protein
MWEHRLIEQMIPLMQKEIQNIQASGRADAVFIEKAVDFFKVYADRTHHGKEEDILFKALKHKPLSGDLVNTMKELMDEHVIARTNVRAVLEAREEYLNGNEPSLSRILEGLTNLINLYPPHIEKEDKRFFFPVMSYFTDQEQDEMLRDFWEFDRKMIHEKYQNVMEQLGAKIKRW